MRIGVDIDGFGGAIERLQSVPEAVQDEAKSGLEDAAETGRDNAERRVRQNTSAVSSGLLADSVRRFTRETAQQVRVTVAAGGRRLEARAGFDYSLTVEFGAEPHFPPVKRVTGRVEALDAKILKEGPQPRTERQREMSPDELAEDVAYRIAQTISEEGIDAQPFMRPAQSLARSEARKNMQAIDVDRLDL